MQMPKKSIVVGMSGGIDSSVAALLLKREGFDVIGVQMEYWSEQDCDEAVLFLPNQQLGEKVSITTGTKNKRRKKADNKCCSRESMVITRNICSHLQIPFYELPIKERFFQNVVSPYLEGYEAGDIPNPCTGCNRTIKFGALLDFATAIGADFVATGHYGRLDTDKTTGKTCLYTPVDTMKDQTYFLHTLTQEQLQKVKLPLGALTKQEVRYIAEQEGLTAYKKNYKESQGLCFFEEKTPEGFLERHGSEELKTPGPMVNHRGEIVGTHRGLIYYTIGQRKGLGVGGLSTPYFVLAIDRVKNRIVVGPKELLMNREVELRNMHFQGGEEELGSFQAKVRYRMKNTPCRLSKDEKSFTLTFEEPVFAITPGQAAVIYDGDRVVGGGIITNNPVLTSLQTHATIQIPPH